MDPLTPNTAAILDYLAANYDTNTNSDDLNLLNSVNDNMSFPGMPGMPAAAPSIPQMPFQTLNKGMPNSLPPSAFNMPLPGRDTPEATPESTKSTSNSPKQAKAAEDADGSDSDALVAITDTTARRKSVTGAGQGAQNKRKAGHTHKVEQVSDEDDDSESDDPAGHEDKRQHPNDRLSPPAGKKGPRKSKGEDGQKVNKETKAARRKEQNRAAQKAFRERREAKVKDLEDHIADLEAKNKGQTTENENLRNLLRSLQDENVRLKQSAFTFQMPMNGASTPARATPVQDSSRRASDATPLSRDPVNPVVNTNVNSAPNFLQHRSSTGGSSAPADSPQSMTSGTTASTSSIPSAQAHPTFDSTDMFNAFASGVRPEWIKKPFGQYEQVQSQPQPPSNTTSTAGSNPSLSPQNSDNADLQALWASFFPQGSNNVNGNIGQTMNNVQPQQQFSNLGNADMSPFNMFATNGMTNANFNTNANMNVNVNDKMAFRDNTTSDFSQLPQFKTGYTPGINGQTFDWGNDSNDFLASLMGNPDVSAESQDVSAEDAFTAQLQKLLDQSGTGAAAALNSPDQLFGMPNSGGNWMNFGMGMGNGLGNTTMVNNSSGSPNAWSPSNYLNMSPFASSGSASASDSPSSNLRESSASLSNSASPEPNVNGHMPMPKASSPNTTVVQVPAADPDGSKRAVQNVFAAAKRGDVVHVVGEDGQILKPSDVWVRMGMHHSNQVSDLLIDDLCDQMKEKATCKDGSYRLHVRDAERMFRYKGEEAKADGVCPMTKSA